MTMAVTQVRLPEGLIREVDNLVNKGFYTNKSDVIRDAIRKLIIEKQIGSIPDTGDSVTEVKRIRKQLSKEKFDLNKINRLSK
ncbi:MAG: ribbon-helix-helix domain-containing protein [Nanoarchaeota archaeon]|nr:ribbon-helix-helix domain-containing protein [Nanoarchaeota archaeon]